MAGVKFAVAIEGIETVRDLEAMGRNVRSNVVKALNKIAAQERDRAARLISGQINLPSGYLSRGQKDRLQAISGNEGNLTARIRARGRPTSLARFVVGNPGFNRAGVSVAVQPGKSEYLKRAFLVRLPGAQGDTETKFNAGLAVRVRPGETIRNKRNQVRLAKNLYLLYGPSVQQVFLDNAGKGVAEDMSKETLAKFEAEFLRLMKVFR